ncbi:hypothetical protein [Parahaliea aestuarii]|uniref:Glycosyltransferase RgtA/B/C/D-like domain-containing protein n=1 Tax=Parahaliea aestuarii TaxID=1852021 RepID=A0A5C8ZUY6_9GAMM|nr:hypothetical protein [Parahaliea aestuarii]TXS92266.1 hypothetical protein FVW59_07510 [Parahaliea aestuarii]
MPANTKPAPTSQRIDIDLRLVAIASLLLSLWLIYLDPLINRDGVLYLRAAQAYLSEGLAASRELFGRPVLSILIAELHRLSGLPLATLGQALTTLCYIGLSVGMVATVATLGGDRRVQLFAAILILSYPVLNDYRSSIMRDPAYWACMIWALRGLLRYAHQPSAGRQWAWYGWMLLAILFRFEGLFFLVLAPLALLLPGVVARKSDALRLLLPPLLAVAVGLAAVVIHQGTQPDGGQLFPIISHYVEQVVGLPDRFHQLASDTAAALLVFSAREDAGWVAVTGLLTILMLNVFRAISWPWLAVLVWGYLRRGWERIAPRDQRLLNANICIALLYLALFTFGKHFMLERYASIVALLCMPYLAFTLSGLWQRAGGRAGKVIAALLLIGTVGDVLHNGDYKKAFIADAARWLREQTPANASLAANDMYIAWSSQRSYDWSQYSAHDYGVNDLFQRPDLWQGRDYLAMEVKRAELPQWQRFLEQEQLQEVQVFGSSGRRSIHIVNLRGAATQKP